MYKNLIKLCITFGVSKNRILMNVYILIIPCYMSANVTQIKLGLGFCIKRFRQCFAYLDLSLCVYKINAGILNCSCQYRQIAIEKSFNVLSARIIRSEILIICLILKLYRMEMHINFA
jgi:hypothetical protein